MKNLVYAYREHPVYKDPKKYYWVVIQHHGNKYGRIYGRYDSYPTTADSLLDDELIRVFYCSRSALEETGRSTREYPFIIVDDETIPNYSEGNKFYITIRLLDDKDRFDIYDKNGNILLFWTDGYDLKNKHEYLHQYNVIRTEFRGHESIVSITLDVLKEDILKETKVLNYRVDYVKKSSKSAICENCKRKIKEVVVHRFNYDGSDGYTKEPILGGQDGSCHYLDIDTKATMFEFSNCREEFIKNISCPLCNKYPFKGSISIYKRAHVVFGIDEEEKIES